MIKLSVHISAFKRKSIDDDDDTLLMLIIQFMMMKTFSLVSIRSWAEMGSASQKSGSRLWLGNFHNSA